VAHSVGRAGLSPTDVPSSMLGGKFKERLSYDDVRAARGAVADAFAKGDYVYVARYGEAQPELQGCAFILIGNPRRGLAILDDASIASNYSQVLRAFAHWYLGEDREALAILDGVVGRDPDNRLASRLKSLIEGDCPNVLVTSSRSAVANALKNVDGFRVMSAGVPGQDVDFVMDGDLRLGADSAARSYLEKGGIFLQFDMGGPIPSDLGQAPFLRYAYVPDPEMHVANDGKDLCNFDRVITCCSQMSLELESLYGCPTLTLPLFGGLTSMHQSLNSEARKRKDRDYLGLPRPIDILFTGSIGTPLYVDKPTRFLALSQLPEKYDIRLLDRTYPSEVYETLLTLAKFVPASFRWLDGLGSRTIQALRNGTFVLANENTALDLYFNGDEEGVCFFQEVNLTSDIPRILDGYETRRAAFERSRPRFDRKLQELFPSSPVVEERWLKTLVFLGLDQSACRTDVQRVNRAYNWMTGRAFPRKEGLEDYFLPDPEAPDYRVKALALKASRSVFEQKRQPMDEIAFGGTEGPMSAADSLTASLIQAFAAWVLENRDSFAERMRLIWRNRESFQPCEWDALPFFDLKLATYLRRSFVSDALVQQAHICCALARAGRLPSAASASPRDVLLSGVGAFLAGLAYEQGDFREAAELAGSALAYFQKNFVAQQIVGRGELRSWAEGEGGDFEKGELLWRDSVEVWPWYLPEIFPTLRKFPDLDARLLEGESHRVFLRFAQRVRTDRAYVANLGIPICSRAYLRKKLAFEIDPAAFEFDKMARALEDHGLRCSEPEFFRRHIVLPLCWDGAVALRGHDPGGAAEILEALRQRFGDLTEALESDYTP